MDILPKDISEKRFTYSKGTYKAEEVDEFLRQVKDAYTKCYGERNKYQQRMEQLAVLVDEYRKQEDEIKSALIIAQRTAKEVTDEAEAFAKQKKEETIERCKKAIAMAKKQAAEEIEKAEKELAIINEQIDSASQKRDKVLSEYKDSVKKYSEATKDLYEKQVIFVDNLCQNFLNDISQEVAESDAEEESSEELTENSKPEETVEENSEPEAPSQEAIASSVVAEEAKNDGEEAPENSKEPLSLASEAEIEQRKADQNKKKNNNNKNKGNNSKKNRSRKSDNTSNGPKDKLIEELFR